MCTRRDKHGICDACAVRESQGGKSLPDFLFDNGKLYVTLTQKDTLSLTFGFNTEIQLAIRCGQMVYRSDIITVETERILKDGEI